MRNSYSQRTVGSRCRTLRRRNPSPFHYFPPSAVLQTLLLKSQSSVQTFVQSKASITSTIKLITITSILFFIALILFCLLDFRIAENDFFKQDWRARSKIEIFQYIFMKWLLCFFIGIIVSLIGFANNLAVENLAGVKFVVTSNMMLAGR